MLELQDRRLAFTVAGVGDPPVLFVHGWTSDHTYLQPQFDHLAAAHRVVSFDLRGHGASSAPPATAGNYSIGAFADDAQEVAAAAQIARPIVVGHSLGALVALELCVRGFAAGGVLIEAPPIVNEKVAERIRTGGAAIASDLDGSWRRQYLELLFSPGDTVRRQEIIDGCASMPADIAMASYAAMSRYDPRAALAGTTVPLAWIGADVATDPPRELARLAPSLLIARTLGAGHFNQLEVPDQVNAMIDRFLRLRF